MSDPVEQRILDKIAEAEMQVAELARRYVDKIELFSIYSQAPLWILEELREALQDHRTKTLEHRIFVLEQRQERLLRLARYWRKKDRGRVVLAGRLPYPDTTGDFNDTEEDTP